MALQSTTRSTTPRSARRTQLKRLPAGFRAPLFICTAVLAVTTGTSPAHAGDLPAAVRVANAVYPSVPQRCGTVTIEHRTLTPPNDTSGAVAEAHELECTVRIKPGIAAAYSDASLCSLLTHEWGHLAGRRFPNNPDDPAHSPDPADNMYARWLNHHPACGESDEARAAREAGEHSVRLAMLDATARRDQQLDALDGQIEELKEQLQEAKRAKRRARGAKRARYARRIKRLRAQIRRLNGEYRALVSAPLL